jgi:class 3 adenylate cyclase
VTDLRVDENSPEFHIVVRRPSTRSPLAPYRFALTVLFAFVVGGTKLWAALRDGTSLDGPVTRVLAAALFAWIMLGVVNRVSKPAHVPSEPAGAAEESSRDN